MKIVTKNNKLENGVRHYLVYLNDDNNNSIECFDVIGEEKRMEKENELSKKYGLTERELEFVSLEKFLSGNRDYTPLILVFYLERSIFSNREMVESYGENVRKYLENRGDDVRLFFLPTDKDEKIECINPVYIGNENELEKLNDLIEDLTTKFQVGVE